MPEKMLAARFYTPNQPLVLEEVMVPKIGPDELLVEVRACGLCGTDLHIIKGDTPPGKIPQILGHESAGVIAEVGEAVEGFKSGDRVVIDCVTSCGSCFTCQIGRDSICVNRKLVGITIDGALAKYVKVKQRNLIALPDKISFEQGSLITDAVATPYHALKARANLRPGESIAIFGAGGLGTHATMLARIFGATPIIVLDISETKLARARRIGADTVINVSQTDPVKAIRELTRGQGADVAIECVGSGQTTHWAAECTAIGARVVVVGHSPELLQLMGITQFVRKEITIMGSSGFEIKEIEQLIDLAASGRLDLSRSVTDTFPLAQVNNALDRLMHHSQDIIRLVINTF